jgi:hypothetical protein
MANQELKQYDIAVHAIYPSYQFSDDFLPPGLPGPNEFTKMNQCKQVRINARFQRGENGNRSGRYPSSGLAGGSPGGPFSVTVMTLESLASLSGVEPEAVNIA